MGIGTGSYWNDSTVDYETNTHSLVLAALVQMPYVPGYTGAQWYLKESKVWKFDFIKRIYLVSANIKQYNGAKFYCYCLEQVPFSKILICSVPGCFRKELISGNAQIWKLPIVQGREKGSVECQFWSLSFQLFNFSSRSARISVDFNWGWIDHNWPCNISSKTELIMNYGHHLESFWNLMIQTTQSTPMQNTIYTYWRLFRSALPWMILLLNNLLILELGSYIENSTRMGVTENVSSKNLNMIFGLSSSHFRFLNRLHVFCYLGISKNDPKDTMFGSRIFEPKYF